MCRLLYMRSEQEFDIAEYLEKFAFISKNSKEYQGHGWGFAYLKNDQWQVYKNINPIWEDNFDIVGKTTILIGHARSAFQDKDIRVENNMPFTSSDIIYIFNGELHGVKIQEEGRIGAEKIFNFILRFNKGNLFDALKKGTAIIERRSKYIRAMNIIMADKKLVYLSTLFNEDKEYFTMHVKKKSNKLIICSDPFPEENGWRKIENRTIKVF
jgi:predicted glutamine amidotransferase